MQKLQRMAQQAANGSAFRALVSGLAASAFVWLAASNAFAADPVPVPTVESTPPGTIFNEPPVDLASLGIVQEEFFFSGTTAEGAYKSRMIVRRPADQAAFNGTVVVEWMNASSGNDIDVDFLSMLPLMLEHGYAYVGVTAQQITVDFLRNYVPLQPRYASLFMDEDLAAGQPAAFEVFSQAGRALLENGGAGADPMGGLQVERLIAIGQSQSSGRLTTMVGEIHGVVLEGVYDAYIPHSGGGAPAAFPAPVFKLNSENEAPGYFGSRGVSDPNYRYWEVPGTSHQPLEGNQYAIDLLTLVRGFFPTCPFPYEGPGGPAGIDPVLRAAVVYLDDWIQTGTPPPQAPLIDMVAGSGSSGVIQRDSYGNALGGIRLPQMEAPTGRNTPSYGCLINFPPIGTIVLATFPQWDAFDGDNDPAVDPTDSYAPEPASAKAVYKSHGGYVKAFVQATDAIEADGFILDFDADRLRTEAAMSAIAK